jgi:hypothetical protein
LPRQWRACDHSMSAEFGNWTSTKVRLTPKILPGRQDLQ